MFIQIRRIFMLIVVHLAAFHPAFSTKMHCKMPQNADQYAAKRKAKCNNMHNEMQQNTANVGT